MSAAGEQDSEMRDGKQERYPSRSVGTNNMCARNDAIPGKLADAGGSATEMSQSAADECPRGR
jgi:hypothetical protein